MTQQRPTLRPDARLVRLHAERGDPQARLAEALADLEGADWGLLYENERALAQQLVALLGRGTLRVDARVPVNRAALAEAGLAVAPLDGDWRGAQAVWLLEPEAADLGRARNAGIPVIVDGTLAPGGGWLAGGADLILYRDSATLTGHADAPLAALFGPGQPPRPEGRGPSDLSVALTLRDLATLPLRLARAARTAAQLQERLGGAAQPVGPTALLLAPDALPDSASPLGGVISAARSVQGGVLLTPGLDDVELNLSQLQHTRTQETRTSAEERPASPAQAREVPQRQAGRRDDRQDQPRHEQYRQDQRQRGGQRRGERPTPPSQPDVPERVTFESPHHVEEETEPLIQPPAAGELAEETWEPEIVFSDIAQEQVKLPIPVSSGPDAPNLGDIVPDVRHQASAQAVQEAAPAIAPDLPSEGKEDPAANLSTEQAAIYARLREWRNQEAKRQEISRFIIASNATLAEIARRVPYTPADLKAVKGMGPERMKKYGEKILEVVRG